MWDTFKGYTKRDRLIRVPEEEMKEITLGENQRNFINQIICGIEKFNSDKISKLSHEEGIWLATSKDASISADFIEAYYKDHPSALLSDILEDIAHSG